MSNEIWINKEMDLLKTLENKEYDLLIKYASDNQQHIISQWLIEKNSLLKKYHA